MRVLDTLGALFSGACAVHCALTPLLLTALPALASHGAETTFRRVLVLIGIVGVGLGAWVHKSRDALLPLCAAITLALCFELHWVNLAVEVFPSLLLSACLITAHALNSRACHLKSQCCAADHCDEPFWGLLRKTSAKGPGNTSIVLSAAALVHAFVFSLVAHAGAASAAAPVPASSEVQVELAELAPQPPVAAPLPEVASPARPTAPAAPAPPPAVAAAAAPVAFERALGPATPTDVAPVRFSDVLGKSAFGVPVGGSGASAAQATNGAGAVPQAVSPSAPVAARELSRRPVPPAHLAGLIRARYPSAARASQLEGTGRARLLISANGTVTSAVSYTESVSGSGFASACASAMKNTSGWGIPLDRDGNPVSTWIHFTCEFAITH